MKETLKSILVYTLIMYFVLNLFNSGIKLPTNPTYLVLTLLMLSFTVMIACPLLSFLAVKCKFLPFFLMTSLLLIGILYVLKIFMIDFYIESFTFEGLSLGSLQVESLEIIPILCIGVASVVSAFSCAIYRELDSN